MGFNGEHGTLQLFENSFCGITNEPSSDACPSDGPHDHQIGLQHLHGLRYDPGEGTPRRKWNYGET